MAPDSGPGAPRRYMQLEANAPFSSGVLAGDTFYLSGRIGFDGKRKTVSDTVEAETRNLMEDVRSVLARAGRTMEGLVFVQIFCSDISPWEQFNFVYRTFFPADMPARSIIGSGKLLLARGSNFRPSF